MDAACPPFYIRCCSHNILHEYKIHNADILFREDIGSDELIDLIEGNRKYVSFGEWTPI